MSSERARLTALYGGLLVLAGALLMGLVYLLVSEGLYASVLTAVAPAGPPGGTPAPGRGGRAPLPAGAAGEGGQAGVRD
ncbi:two-component sensor histidine kinase, partial [Streptomyces sp. NPDC094048]